MSLIFAVGANLTFALAATIFADFSREVSGKWINCFKLFVALGSFVVVALIIRDPISIQTIPYYLLSGALGLFCADHFLCNAFAKLGSARTLMLFSFSPLFVAGWSYLFFAEHLVAAKFIAILFFICCVITLSLEKYKIEGHWEVPGLFMALGGIVLDGLGNVVTRYAFKVGPNNGLYSVCAIRAVGAFAAFVVFKPFLKLNVLETYSRLRPNRRMTVLGASFLGTFISLSFWISAVKRGNLTTLVALGGMTPLFAGMFEIMFGRSRITKFLLIALVFFSAGFYFLVKEETTIPPSLILPNS